MSKKKTNRKPYQPKGITITNTILPAVATVFRGKKGTEHCLNSTISQAAFQKELIAHQKELEKQTAEKQASSKQPPAL